VKGNLRGDKSITIPSMTTPGANIILDTNDRIAFGVYSKVILCFGSEPSWSCYTLCARRVEKSYIVTKLSLELARNKLKTKQLKKTENQAI
jgi:hypothetical protein